MAEVGQWPGHLLAFNIRHHQGWTTPTALRSVRHSVVELVHPALAIGASNTHHVINATSTKIGVSNLNAITSCNMVNNHSASRNHTTSSSSV